MSDYGFQTYSVTRGLPFQALSVFDDFPRFIGASGRVIMAPGTAERLSLAAQEAAPDELAGLLCGRVLRDATQCYTVVVGHVAGLGGVGRPDGVYISGEAMSDLRRRAARSFPATDVIGWWHSHAEPSGYSAADRDHQRIWTDENSVGIVVFAKHFGASWGTAYLGPQANPLPDYKADGGSAGHG